MKVMLDYLGQHMPQGEYPVDESEVDNYLKTGIWAVKGEKVKKKSGYSNRLSK